MSKTLVSFTPTFLLRKVDPSEVATNYLNGKYQKITLPEKKVTVVATTVSIIPVHGNSPHEEIYTFRDKNNNLRTVYTNNHKDFALALNNGGSIEGDGECSWCREIGPLESLVPTSVKIVKVDSKNIIVFYGEERQCCTGCSYAYYKRIMGRGIRYQDPLYMDSETLLKYLHHCRYPNGPALRECPDFRLLAPRGPLSREEFFKGQMKEYVRIPNIILCPLKVPYQVQTEAHQPTNNVVDVSEVLIS